MTKNTQITTVGYFYELGTISRAVTIYPRKQSSELLSMLEIRALFHSKEGELASSLVN
jgi:hypothetical protein